MGYYDKFLMHEDKRDKGMNSTSNEKGTDGKKNNSSEYNHDYYMKNKEKWQDNKGGAKYGEYEDGDPDFDDKNFDEKNRLGDTDFFGFQKPDGSWVILEEDMKWTVPAGMSKEDMTKALESFSKRVEEGNLSFKEWQKAATEAINSASKKKEFDVDAAAKDVIRGKYGDGAERKAALGEDWAVVQKRVDEMMKGDSAKHSEEDEEMDELYHHGIKGQHCGVRRFENADGTLTAAGRSRYGDKADKVERKLQKAVKWENRSANSALGGGLSRIVATANRQKADRLAEKGEGTYKFTKFNKNRARNARALAETDANIAAKLKERSGEVKGLKQKIRMERAIKRLAGAENAEVLGEKFTKVSEARVGKKTSTFIKNTLHETTRTTAGRKSSFGDKFAESLGNYVLNKAMDNAMDKSAEKRGGEASKAVKVGKTLATRVGVTGARDAVYRAKNDQKKRWDSMANG